MSGRNFIGRRVQWCPSCRIFYRVEGDPDVPPACTECHEAPLIRKCYRCGHEWAPRRYIKDPRQCPKCHSPYWNRLRAINPGRPKCGGRP